MKSKRNYHEPINWKKEGRSAGGYIAVGVWTFFTAVILIWILGASLSTAREIFSGTVLKFESGFHFDNYVRAWEVQNVSQFFANSLIYSVTVCICVILISAPCAYTLSRFNFNFRNVISNGLIIAMAIPPIMITMPLFSLSVKWGLRGRLFLIMLYIATRVPYTTIYLLRFFQTLSHTYEEAAAIDGASPAKTFWVIMLPLIQPALVTVTIFNFLGTWNEYFMALIFATNESMMPVGVGLVNIVNSMKYTGDYGGLFAAVVMVFLPTFILYLFLSEKIIAGVTGGGVKG